MVDNNDLLDVFVFVPLNTCGCSYSRFMDRIFAEFIPYKEKLNLLVKDIQGEEAKPFFLFSNSVVIPNPPDRDKPAIFTSYLEFRKFLMKIFPEEKTLNAGVAKL